MVTLSIIIPALGTEKQLEDTLVSVLANRPQDCEVIVVHPGKYADPYDLSDEVCFLELYNSKSYVRFINAGVEKSRGAIIHVLNAGLEVKEGWATRPLEHFAHDEAVGSVSPFVVHSVDPSVTLSVGLRYPTGGARAVRRKHQNVTAMNSDVEIDGPLLSAGFFRGSAFHAVGGLDASITDVMAGFDLALAMRKSGYRCVSDCSATTTGCLEACVIPHNVFQDAISAERIFWRHCSSRSWLKSTVLHAAEIAVETVMSLPFRTVSILGGRSCGALMELFRRGRRSAFSKPHSHDIDSFRTAAGTSCEKHSTDDRSHNNGLDQTCDAA